MSFWYKVGMAEECVWVGILMWLLVHHFGTVSSVCSLFLQQDRTVCTVCVWIDSGIAVWIGGISVAGDVWSGGVGAICIWGSIVGGVCWGQHGGHGHGNQAQEHECNNLD